MMIKKHTLLFVLVAATLFCSCKKETAKETTSIEVAETGPQTHRLDALHYIDSLKVGSRSYVYTLHRDSDEDLGTVIDEYDDKWVNSFYELTVECNGQPFFQKRFVKETLGRLLTEDFKRMGILDGFRFMQVEDGKLIFSFCVSYPNSDMSAPFLLTIAPDGSHSIEPDTVLDVMDEGEEEEF